MIDRATRLLARHRSVSEWTACQRRRVRVQARAGELRELEQLTLELTAHHDGGRGRGSATVGTVAGGTDALLALVGEAVDRARASEGPPWRLPSPAAPARVALADPSLVADPVAAALALLASLTTALEPGGAAEQAAAAPVAAPAASVCIDVDTLELRTSTGLRAGYTATRATLELPLSIGTGFERVAGRVRAQRRRGADLATAAWAEDAARALARRAAAAPLAPGAYDLVLGPGALSYRGRTRHGWLTPLVAQAEGADARRGLVRYLPGQPALPGPRRAHEPLSLVSDGAVDYGTYSRPSGDAGEPTRRFSLITDDVAHGLGLDAREAALRGVSPNGGVRNLELALGSSPAARLAEPGARPLVRIEQLDALDVDPRSGALVAAIGLGARLDGQPQPFRGAVLRANVFELLAGAQLAAEQHDAGWLRGPSALRIDDVVLL